MMDIKRNNISIELVFTFHNMTPIILNALGTQNLLTPIDDSHIGIFFFLLSKGDDLGQKNALSAILCASPYPSDALLHHTAES